MRILLVLLFFQASGFTCELIVPAKILITSEKVYKVKSLKANNCNQNELYSFYQLLQNSKGRTSLVLLREKLNISFKSASPFLEIIHLKDLLRKKIISRDSKRNFKKMKSPADQDAYLLNEDQYVKIDCYNCNSGSSSVINYQVSFQDSMSKRHKMTAKLIQTQSFKVYKAIRDIPVFKGNLSKNAFESIVLETNKPNNYFEDMPAIHFLKTTRSIKKGEILLKSHFAYKKVIKTGQILTVELKNNNISLITNGKAMQTGRINETIQVKSLNSKKVYSAKITGPGKAEVRL